VAHFHLGCCYYWLGDQPKAVEKARETFETSIRIGEDSRAHSALCLWTKASHGELPFEELKNCFRSVPEDIVSTDDLLMAEGYWHTFHGRTAAALQAFEQAYDLPMRRLLINFHTAETLPALVMALRLHAEAIESTQPSQSRQLRRRALRRARWAARIARLFPTQLPVSLRELSLLLAGEGKIRQAHKLAERSSTTAHRQGARYESAKSMLLCGHLAARLELADAERQIRDAEAALDEIEAATVSSLGNEPHIWSTRVRLHGRLLKPAEEITQTPTADDAVIVAGACGSTGITPLRQIPRRASELERRVGSIGPFGS
jgi:hypothetical protein